MRATGAYVIQMAEAQTPNAPREARRWAVIPCEWQITLMQPSDWCRSPR
jgi:hypothetical protein